MNPGYFFRQLYFKSTGYSFTHMGRLFLRLFVGLMLAQFGVRQLEGWITGDELLYIPFVAGGLHTWLVIVVEIVCSFLIMIGLFMRAMIIPPFVLMIASCHHTYLLHGLTGPVAIQLLTVPFMFMGIYMFLCLVGPGKISIDYFLSLYLIHRNQNQDKEEDLEEV